MLRKYLFITILLITLNFFQLKTSDTQDSKDIVNTKNQQENVMNVIRSEIKEIRKKLDSALQEAVNKIQSFKMDIKKLKNPKSEGDNLFNKYQEIYDTWQKKFNDHVQKIKEDFRQKAENIIPGMLYYPDIESTMEEQAISDIIQDLYMPYKIKLEEYKSKLNSTLDNIGFELEVNLFQTPIKELNNKSLQDLAFEEKQKEIKYLEDDDAMEKMNNVNQNIDIYNGIAKEILKETGKTLFDSFKKSLKKSFKNDKEKTDQSTKNKLSGLKSTTKSTIYQKLKEKF